MTRWYWLLAVALTLPFAPGVASAQPAESPCDYTLSAPYLLQVSGTNMVAATLSPAGCHQANVILTVACVQREGSQQAGRCAQNNGPLVAQVLYGTYEPGATYVSTGRGCATTGNPPQQHCASSGPFTATL
jgi:hypothetical protein